MKAAILKEIGTIPFYGEHAEPIVESNDQVLVKVKASSIKHLDLARASGKHYTTYDNLPAVVGMDGVAVLENGQRIYAMGITGMMAKKAIVQKDNWVIVPEGLDDCTAAALPNFLVGSDAALRLKGSIKVGDIILINGATGSTGMMAVQMAKFHHAGFIIATGRNPEVLEKLKELGADLIISLNQPEEQVINDFKEAYSTHPFDIVVDYLWGRPSEMLLEALSMLPSQKETKIITVGGMAGPAINLNSANLRSKNIVLMGSGIGSISKQELSGYLLNSLPEIFEYAATGKLYVDLKIFPLEEVTNAWSLNESGIVIKI
ncbi:zinc-binding dehydrogenase [Chryseobacterium sp. WG14]|uniref:quinone oxidoreductase family protein n=1 Tax=unclassified Chryseobacterium TaxID=2593645 RepID=UPI00211F14F5|nr:MULTISPECIES: zinc-binding dehydrogenase [unclassified Chryseobacterium]MCQ9636349.1 zinc-binding dehydrogenase [Chryseobacterium sp. WG23]MCQ9641531.1 zinc-binding dehydrogenase [Chryseobacterium sp. WG14]